MTEEEKVAEKQKPEYRVVEDYRPQDAQKQLNELAAEGYELKAVTPAGEDDMGRLWIFWTLRLRRELRTPANPPLLTTVAASLVEWQERVEELSKLTQWLRSYHQTTLVEVSQRLELLESWRRDVAGIADRQQPASFGNEE